MPSAFTSLSVPLNIVLKFLFDKSLQTVHIKGIIALNGWLKPLAFQPHACDATLGI